MFPPEKVHAVFDLIRGNVVLFTLTKAIAFPMNSAYRTPRLERAFFSLRRLLRARKWRFAECHSSSCQFWLGGQQRHLDVQPTNQPAGAGSSDFPAYAAGQLCPEVLRLISQPSWQWIGAIESIELKDRCDILLDFHNAASIASVEYKRGTAHGCTGRRPG
jgi:hypothetical protein